MEICKSCCSRLDKSRQPLGKYVRRCEDVRCQVKAATISSTFYALLAAPRFTSPLCVSEGIAIIGAYFTRSPSASRRLFWRSVRCRAESTGGRRQFSFIRASFIAKSHENAAKTLRSDRPFHSGERFRASGMIHFATAGSQMKHHTGHYLLIATRRCHELLLSRRHFTWREELAHAIATFVRLEEVLI